MTPEQKRIIALEETVLVLVTALEDSRIGFGTRFASLIRAKMKQNREAYRFTQKKPQPSTSAAPVEGETP